MDTYMGEFIMLYENPKQTPPSEDLSIIVLKAVERFMSLNCERPKYLYLGRNQIKELPKFINLYNNKIEQYQFLGMIIVEVDNENHIGFGFQVKV